MSELEAISNKVFMELLRKQENLPHDMEKLLYDNLWDLYDDSPQPTATQPDKDEQNKGSIEG